MTTRVMYTEKLKELKCVVIIPTYNNERTIAQVIDDVKQYACDIYVVNDGSTDHTALILSAIPDIRVFTHLKNKGKGASLKEALKEAAAQGFRYALTIDADGQHFAKDIPVFVERIEQKPGSLLIGARNLEADNMPSKNTFANRFSNFWYKVETGQKLSDTQSGYRLYPLQPLQNIRLLTHRYEFEVEIIVRAAWKGIHVENVPIKVYYPPAEERVSHFKPVKDFARISLLNTILVLYALLFYYPWRFVRSLTLQNIKQFFNTHVFHSQESGMRIAAAMGWGIFCGIIPIWGYQMIFAAVTAHFLRLNKIITLVFSNISIPPMIPFLLYGSVAVGSWILHTENTFTLDNISFNHIRLSLTQYLIGSVIFGAIAGILTFLTGWVSITIYKRNKSK